MKNSIRKGKREEVSVDNTTSSSSDEMNEIKEFIRKKQLQNQVLKKLSEKIEFLVSHEIEKSKSA